ncbi:MAG: potassium transporter TrkG, partial [Sulfolobales archaeon]
VLHLSLLSSGITSFSYIDSLFETASALSCVGLSSGIASSSAPVITKVLLMVAMYLGRIEFLPLYTLVGIYYISKITL